jgi:hypothetical protein
MPQYDASYLPSGMLDPNSKSDWQDPAHADSDRILSHGIDIAANQHRVKFG